MMIAPAWMMASRGVSRVNEALEGLARTYGQGAFDTLEAMSRFRTAAFLSAAASFADAVAAPSPLAAEQDRQKIHSQEWLGDTSPTCCALRPGRRKETLTSRVREDLKGAPVKDASAPRSIGE